MSFGNLTSIGMLRRCPQNRRMQKTPPEAAYAIFMSIAGYEQGTPARKLKVPLAKPGTTCEQDMDVRKVEVEVEIGVREMGIDRSPVMVLATGPHLPVDEHVRRLEVEGFDSLAALPLMAEASLLAQQEGNGLVKWRLHTQFEVDRYVPTQIDVTRNGGGEADERSVLERNIQSDHCYVMDRGYAKFTLFNKIHWSGSSYVCRLRDNSTYEVLEDRPLSEAAKAAGIVFDGVVRLGATSKADASGDPAASPTLT